MKKKTLQLQLMQVTLVVIFYFGHFVEAKDIP